jgi:hypothetical protein
MPNSVWRLRVMKHVRNRRFSVKHVAVPFPSGGELCCSWMYMPGTLSVHCSTC